jgi:FtsP/CotA-like multicopper oxidase with cupredoxin domain
MKRRDFFKLSAITATWLLTGCGGGGTRGMMSNMDLSYSTFDFTPYLNTFTPLIIPPLLLPTTDVSGVKNYDLTIQKATHTFFSGFDTATYAVNGTYLAPTLKVTNGDTVSINFTNNLDEPTTMHGHGMHLPATMDGAAHQPIAAGATWSAQYTVNQRACTNWYHPHYMGKTAQHVYKGLAGVIILEDTEILGLDLPKTYGVDDIPLVLQDRIFETTAQFDYSPSLREIMQGYKGDTFITNGVYNATLDVEAKEIRFRILNGSNATVYNLQFSDGRTFKQIGTDNSLLEAPVSMTSLKLSPAERAEIVVDFSADLNGTFYLQEITQGKNFLRINVPTVASSTTTTPATLTTLIKNTLAEAVRTRTFSLSASGPGDLRINGVSMDINVINERVLVNDVEIWEVTNTMPMNHNFHMHGSHFLVAERNGSSANVLANELGYKDTVLLEANDTVKLIVKMTDYTDTTNPYMYHCHFLEHEDAGMMGQFTVE